MQGKIHCDNTASLTIIVEKTFKWNTGLYLVDFVDFGETLDSVDQELLSKILKNYGINEKITRKILVFYHCFKARVFHDGDVTDPYGTSTGVCPWCKLSPLLFLVALNWATLQALGTETGIQLTQ